MKKWYLVGNMGGMKMLYYIGVFATMEEAKEKAIIRYNIKKKNVASLVLESQE